MKNEKNTITLTRAYSMLGTQGIVTTTIDNVRKFHSYMLERLWKNNERSKSCIPEGTYELAKRFTEKRGWHVILKNVPNRQFILIHSGADVIEDDELDIDTNNNKVDSLGCLLPQTNIMLLDTVSGGLRTPRPSQAGSREATKRLTELIFKMIDENGTAYIEITSLKYSNV